MAQRRRSRWALAHALLHWQRVEMDASVCYLWSAVLLQSLSLKFKLPGIDGTHVSVNFQLSC